MEWSSSLVLDGDLRDWVLLPIVLVMTLVSLFRFNLTKLLVSDKKDNKEVKVVREAHILQRSRRLRANHHQLPAEAFHGRRDFFTNPDHGLFNTMELTETNPMEAMMDPNNLKTMMKKNMAMIVSQVLLFNWVNYFFSGFVLVRLPFPLTLRFKGMLQKGIDLQYLDVTYVSSLSWYVMNLFGLKGINSLILGESVAATPEDAFVRQQMSGANAQQLDTKKAVTAEREEMLLIQHSWSLTSAEDFILSKYPPPARE